MRVRALARWAAEEDAVSKRRETTYGRTPSGQAVYDVYFSSMSAAECARRHRISREFVLEQRRTNPLRKRALVVRPARRKGAKL